MADTLEKINLKLEKAIWQGDKQSDNADLNKFDGLLKLAANEEDTINITYAESDSAWNKIKAIILALPEEVLESSGRAVIFVGTDLFRNFMLEVVEKNFYHYSGPQNEDVKEFVFPGTNVIVASTVGLSRTGKLYGSHDRNLYYGCDLLDAKEEVAVKWDEMDGVFKVKVKWNSGVQTAFPDLVVVSSPAGPGPEPTVPTISGASSLNLANTAGSNDRTYATSDGSDIEAAVATEGADWLDVEVAENGHTVTFTRTAQAVAAEARTATVHLSTATGASKDVTVTQAAGPAE